MSTAPDLKFAFGNFNYICSTVSLTLCPLVGGPDGIEPVCYSRNVRIADTLIFQPCKSFFLFSLFMSCLWPCGLLSVALESDINLALNLPPSRKKNYCHLFLVVFIIPATLIIHIIALIMTAIMIYHIRSKYTAVGKLSKSWVGHHSSFPASQQHSIVQENATRSGNLGKGGMSGRSHQSGPGPKKSVKACVTFCSH